MRSLWPGTGGPVIDYISQPPPRLWQEKRQRSLVILGSTGSIGRNAISALDAAREPMAVCGLACGRNIELLASQAARLRPGWLACQEESGAVRLAGLLPADYRPRILFGRQGYATLASLPEADTVLSAQSGSAGLGGTLAAALAGKVICLANKESLVMAGFALRKICALSGASILPVDSEHNAIFQCLAGRGQQILALILTASGGPFRGMSAEDLAGVGPQDALRHPTWNMGAKISIDSASMMNKGLEIIEACHLFGVGPELVRVLVHPQSIVHSLVEFPDMSMLAQMACADMRLAIGDCLFWPRPAMCGVERLDLARIGQLDFFEPDNSRFPCPGLARQAFARGAGACIALNAANEAAVELFLEERIPFTLIPRLIAKTLQELDGECREPALPAWPWHDIPAMTHDLLAQLDGADAWARELVRNLAQSN